MTVGLWGVDRRAAKGATPQKAECVRRFGEWVCVYSS